MRFIIGIVQHIYSKEDEMGTVCSTVGEKSSVWKFWRVNLNSPLGTCVYRGEDKAKIGLKEVGWEGMDWLCLSQERNK
jgi:hypothetical protein